MGHRTDGCCSYLHRFTCVGMLVSMIIEAEEGENLACVLFKIWPIKFSSSLDQANYVLIGGLAMN